MTKLEKLFTDLARIEAAIRQELERDYPIGMKVTYRLRGGKDADRYPWQQGKVVGYAKDGKRLRVQLALSRASRGLGYTHRRVETLPISKVRPNNSTDSRSVSDA